ncbi:MAG: cytochrome c biogenesis protein CcsA [Pseudomonadota bacterium]
MTATLPGLLAIVLYLLASGLLLAKLMHGVPCTGCQRNQPLMLGLAAVFIHGSILYPAIITASGLNLGIFYAASLVAMTTALLLVLASFIEPVENLGIPVFVVAALCIGLTMIYPAPHTVTNAASWQLDSHILASLLAYSILGLAVLQALLLAIQDSHLRNRTPGGFIRALPPLQTMESLLFQMIATGFTLLTLALVTGVLFLEDIFSQHLVHKTTLSIIAWIVFAILLWGRWRFGWRGRVAIRWTIGGFIFLMLAYFGSKFVLELVINR